MNAATLDEQDDLGDPARRDEQDQRAALPANELLDELRLQLQQHASERPYTVILAALAAGYVLGGGIPGWALRAASTAGSRFVVASVAAAVLGERAGDRLR